jgi:hypothetical protein
VRPTAIQYTISIRATGEVVVQFQNMRHPPFDTPAAREPLRVLLNSIPGVELQPDRLNGRPTFPLSALRGEPALAMLRSVLDRIVDESSIEAQDIPFAVETTGETDPPTAVAPSDQSLA